MVPEAWLGYIKARPSDVRRLNGWVRSRPVMVASGVFEGALVGTCLVHAWLASATRREVHGVALGFAEVLPRLKAAADLGDPSDIIEEVRDEIQDTINQVLGAMRVPTGGDHALGMIASIGQMWAAHRFGLTPQPGLDPALAAPSDGLES
jgi:hypothetical protein